MLQSQIKVFRRRLWLMSWAMWVAAVALLGFLAAVLAGGLSMAYPSAMALKGVGTVALMLGVAHHGGRGGWNSPRA
jgi:hypothetical protein